MEGKCNKTFGSKATLFWEAKILRPSLNAQNVSSVVTVFQRVGVWKFCESQENDAVVQNFFYYLTETQNKSTTTGVYTETTRTLHDYQQSYG